MKSRAHYFMRASISMAWLLLCPVLQVRATDPPPSAHIHGSEDSLLVYDVRARYESVYEERQFAERFNRLIFSLQSFSETYNSGHVIDVKRVKAVKKAWREFGEI